jgi:hypothetical protein
MRRRSPLDCIRPVYQKIDSYLHGNKPDANNISTECLETVRANQGTPH